jgi:hypothetical protein
MSKAEILAELPKIPRRDRREIMDRILELDDQAELLEERRQLADAAFLMLDELEAADAANQTR